MADNKVDIKVTLKEQLDKAQQKAESLNKSNGFSNKTYLDLQSSFQILGNIIEKTGKLTDSNLKRINQIYEKISRALIDASVKIAGASQATQDLINKRTEASETVNQLRQARTDLIANKQYGLDKSGKVARLSSSNITGFSYAKVGTKSDPTKIGRKYNLTEGSTKRANELLSNKDNYVFYKDGKEVDSSILQKAIQDDAEALKNANKELEAANLNISKAVAELADYDAKLEAPLKSIDKQAEQLDLSDILKNQDEVAKVTNNELETRQISENNKKLDEKFDTNITKPLDSTASGVGRVLKQFSLFSVALKTVKTAAREAVSTITQLDKALTDQAMVTGKTRKEAYQMLKQYQSLAVELGSTTKEVSETATEYMRQGKTADEALTLTKAAVSAAKVAAVSASESINYLTTALNGFQLSAEQAMKVSDKFAAVAATSASSYEEIATALSKVASQANLAGMSIDYTTALLAKGLETTREAPETIGTALKTVIARMREITDYGQTLDGSTDVNNVETQLAYVGIKLKDQNGELRSTEDVLDELGKKWDVLNSNQQAAIAKALAGTRQQSRLIAMMSDYERVTELQEVSLRSSGATLAQMEKYTDSLEAATNKLATSWETIVSSIAKSDVIIGIVNSLTKAVEFLNKTLLMSGNGFEKFLGGVGWLALGGSAAKGLLNKANERILYNNKEKRDQEAKIEEEKQRYNQNIAARGEQAQRSGEINEWAKANPNVAENQAVKSAQEEVKAAAQAEEDAKNEVDKHYREVKAAEHDLEMANIEEETAKKIATEEEYHQKVINNIYDEKQKQWDLDKQDAQIKLANGSDAEKEQAQRYIDAIDSKKAELTVQKNNDIAESQKKVTEANNKQTAAIKKRQDAQKTLDAADQKSKDLQTKLSAAQSKNATAQAKLQDAQTKQKDKFLKQDAQAIAMQGRLQLIMVQANKVTAFGNTLLAVQNIRKAAANTINTLATAITKLNSAVTGENNAKQVAAALATKTDTEAKKENTVVKAANTAATVTLTGAVKALAVALATTPIGWIITGLTVIVGLLSAFAIADYFGAFDSQASKAADSVNKLSAEIYSLNEKATKLDSAINSFDKLDNKVIKTSQDLEDMKSQLDEAANYLDAEVSDDKAVKKSFGGVSEQEWYNSLSTDKAKREYLNTSKQKALNDANAKRQEQLTKINSLSGSDRQQFFTSSESKYVQARDAIYAINNNNLYESVDKLKEYEKISDDTASSIESVVSAMLEQVSAEEALDLANNSNRLNAIVETLSDLTTTIDDVNYSYAEILDKNSSFDLKDQVEAYRAIGVALQGDAVALKAFSEQYSEYSVFEKMSDDTLDFIDKVGLTVDKLNDLYTSYSTLQKRGVDISQSEFQDRYYEYLQSLAQFDGDVSAAVESTFSDILSKYTKGTEEYTKVWNAFIDTFGSLVEQGVLNMGQNVDKFSNQITAFYTKASEWSSMSETDKSEFLQDNYELFNGPDGAKLLDAFKTGNYNIIEEALSTNETLLENRKTLLNQVEQELKIELAREGADYNAAYIEQLQAYKKKLEDQNTLFQASLETRLEQQQNAIEQYKSMLESEKTALTDSLDKRKDAYSKYFDAINQEYNDQDYEEQAQTYMTNLAKLGSSTDAASMKQTKDLEQKLEDLEKERLKTLRERAQDALTQSIDDQVTEINNKFDKLLNSQQELLTALTTESKSNPADLFSKLVSTKVSSEGLTAVGLEDYLQTIQSTLGNYLSDIDWNNITTSTDENNNVVLNIAGKEVVLSSDDQQTLYDIILNAFKELGLAG